MSDWSGPGSSKGLDFLSAHETVSLVLQAICRQVVGQNQLQRRLLSALLVEGHILLEGVPGLAKTLSIKALASAVDASFHRIQFTPDLLPADVVGTEVYRPNDGTFEIRKGPVFANFVLADEINRAPAKVQSALLETMQERQVTVGGKTFRVPEPFLVMATQNPLEQEGTYALPEAQVDRFLMKVQVNYPEAKDELEMLDRVTAPGFQTEKLSPVASIEDIRKLQALLPLIYVDERIKDYILRIVLATRDPKTVGLSIDSLIELGASPRATISLFLAARAEAFLQSENYVVPQHVKDIAHDVLRHRIIVSYEAEAQGLTPDALITMILDKVPVP